MHFFIISLSLILFHGIHIYGLENDGLDAIDVLATLKKNVPNCDLHLFVKSDKEYQKLNEDLQTYCSGSETSKQYALICQMLAYELEKACGLPSNLRPTQAVYDIQLKASQVCGLKNVLFTSQWILNKLTNNGQKKISVNPDELCTKVTNDANTIRLARFFYKTAPRVRQTDLPKRDKGLLEFIRRNENCSFFIYITTKHLLPIYYCHE